MSWWEALILGVVQGLTEFFPVSSSGHLVMAQQLLGITVGGIGFEIVVHIATLISVLVVYRERVILLTRGVIGRDRHALEYVGKLALATLPAVAVVLLAGDWVEARFDDPAFTGTMLLVTGSFLWGTRWARGNVRPGPLEFLPVIAAAAVAFLAGTLVAFLAVLALAALIMGVSRATARPEGELEPQWGGALSMGIAQAMAILPGISRSGSTVVTGLWRRIDALAAAEFSFLMSVVAILGAAVQKAPEMLAEGIGVGPLPLVIGFIAAAGSGVLAIRFFVALLRRQNFYTFAWYCWVAGALFLLYLRMGSSPG
ncbi:MAG: undecaprenyl-diphosphate phosphatase [Gemmatimonadota bacterium]|nr:undecaprenyl-diphosphate phosphatase [Gemmatimonadota bacterium]